MVLDTRKPILRPEPPGGHGWTGLAVLAKLVGSVRGTTINVKSTVAIDIIGIQFGCMTSPLLRMSAHSSPYNIVILRVAGLKRCKQGIDTYSKKETRDLC